MFIFIIIKKSKYQIFFNINFNVLAPNVFRPIFEIQDSTLQSENTSSFNNKVQRRKVSDSSAESNNNKFIGSPDDLLLNRTDTGSNISKSAFSMASTSSGQTPIGPPKLSNRPHPSSSQEVKCFQNVLHFMITLIKWLLYP